MRVIAFQFCLRSAPCINSILRAHRLFLPLLLPAVVLFIPLSRFCSLYFLFVTRHTQSKFSSLSLTQELTWPAVWLAVNKEGFAPAGDIMDSVAGHTP